MLLSPCCCWRAQLRVSPHHHGGLTYKRMLCRHPQHRGCYPATHRTRKIISVYLPPRSLLPQNTLGLPVGSLRYPPELAPHLQALQQAAFPLPPPEEAEDAEQQQQQGQGADGGDGGGGGGGGGGATASGAGSSSWPDRPLQRQLALLGELCRGAFGRLQRDVSPSVQLLVRVSATHMPLLIPVWTMIVSC